MTSFYPVSLDVAGRACLVVGGGPVAARKARSLLDCGAIVTVVAPDICAAMAELESLTIERRPYAAGEVGVYRLVITATGDPAVDGAVYADAEAVGVWINSADDLAHCSFILPSVHRDGALTVAVSTAGSSPALASWLRARLAAESGTGLGEAADLLARARQSLHETGRSTEFIDWVALLDGPFLELVRGGEMDKAQALVEAATGTRLER